ncbi:MAG: DUF4124 domain-containing protein [Pseudomonadota bacterium]
MALNAESAVYRGRDKDGNIIYSDRPFEGAKEWDPPAASRYSPPEMPKTTASKDATAPAAAPTETHTNYAAIKIVQPKNDENINENSGNLAVTVDISPGLLKEHRLVAVIDGVRQPVLWNTTSMAVTGVDRGTHKLLIEAVDQQGKKIFGKSPAIVFHMHRASALFRR